MYQERVDLLRQYFPHAGITTDIIVGFPGETDADIDVYVEKMREQLKQLMKNCDGIQLK